MALYLLALPMAPGPNIWKGPLLQFIGSGPPYNWDYYRFFFVDGHGEFEVNLNLGQ